MIWKVQFVLQDGCVGEGKYRGGLLLLVVVYFMGVGISKGCTIECERTSRGYCEHSLSLKLERMFTATLLDCFCAVLIVIQHGG